MTISGHEETYPIKSVGYWRSLAARFYEKEKTAPPREAILQAWPDAESRVHVISRGRGDVADPIGGPLDLYRRCSEQLDGYLKEWAEELPVDGL